jgi:hypothetical protein
VSTSNFVGTSGSRWTDCFEASKFGGHARQPGPTAAAPVAFEAARRCAVRYFISRSHRCPRARIRFVELSRPIGVKLACPVFSDSEEGLFQVCLDSKWVAGGIAGIGVRSPTRPQFSHRYHFNTAPLVSIKSQDITPLRTAC